MFTQCPECHKTHTLTVDQLRTNRGMMHCKQCSVLFDALALIRETEAEAEDKPESRHFPWDNIKLPNTGYWGTAFLLGTLLFVAQVAYFEGYAISQNPAFRPWLEKLCSPLNCALPPYKNLNELTVMHGSFTAMPDHNYAFKAAISNQALFKQPYPSIKLTLLDFDGTAFAHRIFQPQDYLPAEAVASGIAADAGAEINLTIAAPQTPVGGYTFELMY